VYGLAKEVVRLSGSRSKISFQTVDRTDVELRIPSIVKAQKLLGYDPQIDLEVGLLRTIDWYRMNVTPTADIAAVSSGA
jgi:nucleoside-diphosphate-sugar epimerase